MSRNRMTKAAAARRVVVASLALALSATTFTGCAGQQAEDGGASAPVSQAASVDSSSWKTLGDALSAKGDMFSSGYDDTYYVCVFDAGDKYFRVVAKLDDETNKKIDEVDWTEGDVEEKIEQAISGLPLQSVEDISDDVVPQNELDMLVGKTGKEITDEGYAFQDYYMYGGDETGASFIRGYLAYGVTFDVSVPEESTEDGGASVMDAKVTQVELLSASDAATDPTKV